MGVAWAGENPACWALSLSSCVQIPGTVRGSATSSPIPTITVTRHSTVSRKTTVTFDPFPEVSVTCRDSKDTASLLPPPPLPWRILGVPVCTCSPSPSPYVLTFTCSAPMMPCSCAVMVSSSAVTVSLISNHLQGPASVEYNVFNTYI